MKNMKKQTQKTSQSRSLIELSCPRCKKDIGSFVLKQLGLATGLTEKELRNGTLHNLPMIVKAGMFVFDRSGVELSREVISEKSFNRAIDVIEGVIKTPLEKDAVAKYEKKIDDLGNELRQKETQLAKTEKDLEQKSKELEAIQTKTKSNPALKGASAERGLLEEIEASFQEQHFEDITKKGRGDILWSNVRIGMDSGWRETMVNVVLDSKDKSKVSPEDISKLRSDMRFHHAPVGIIVAAKQDQLRQKDSPCGVYRFEEGFVIVTSRENFNHHIAARLVRDVLARMFDDARSQAHKIDVKRLAAILSDLTSINEYFQKVRSKAQNIMEISEDGEAELKKKIDAANKLLQPDTG